MLYNGEIYNHHELHQELEALGHTFKTDADTEVLVHGYEQWGRDGLLERLRGMFAFAIWDANRNALFLARDRMGINVLHDRNPLFVQLSDGGIRNGYTVKILNMELRPRTFTIDLGGLEGGTMAMAGSDAAPGRQLTIEVGADKLRTVQIYVTAQPEMLKGQTTPFQFIATDVEGKETASYDAAFKAPVK